MRGNESRAERARGTTSRAHRRRRRRLLIAAPFLMLVTWAVVSYTIWMVQPTSTSFGARSVEWVRADVPFGNRLVDEAEHYYYGARAPKKGGPQLKRLPAVGLPSTPSSRPGNRQDVTCHCVAGAHNARLLAPAPR